MGPRLSPRRSHTGHRRPGSSYVYPEHNAYALDGSPLDKAVLFNLTGGGARAVDVRVPVPETTKTIPFFVTGRSEADWDQLGHTTSTSPGRGYLCLAIMERRLYVDHGDMDAVLYLEDNALQGVSPHRDSARCSRGPAYPPSGMRDRFAGYSNREGMAGYAGYNAWALDAAADTVRHLIGKPFIMLVNAERWTAPAII